MTHAHTAPLRSGDDGGQNHRWMPQTHLTWLRDDAGPVYLAIFDDLHPRVLLEPTATIWEILVQAGTEPSPGATVEQIMSALVTAGSLSAEQVSDPHIRGDIEGVLTQLHSMGAVDRVP